MNCAIKNIIKTLCEDGHDAMVEKRKANHLPIEDISPYEVIYDTVIKEFEQIEKENAELRECLKEAIVYFRGHVNTYECECDCKDCELACQGRKWSAVLEGVDK